jgi:hypothetical protein
MIQLFLVIIALFLFFSIILTSLKNGIPPVPTSQKVKQTFLECLPSIPPAQIAELGAGWGTLVFALAKKYPTSTVVAYENSLIPFLFMKFRKLFSSRNNLILVYRNFYEVNLSSYDLIVCYLYPGAMRELERKFYYDPSLSATIFTHTFSIPNRKEEEKWKVNDLYQTTIYRYEVKS